MAVGYLKSDWDPHLVLTKNRGEDFYAAVQKLPVSGVGVVFYRNLAFTLTTDEGILEPQEAYDLIYKVCTNQVELDIDNPEVVNVLFDDEGGSTDELTAYGEEDISTVTEYYSDIESVYWNGE